MLEYARSEIQAGPVARPVQTESQRDKATVALVGEMFPVDAITIDRLLDSLGAAAGPVVPTSGVSFAALDCKAAAMIHPFTPRLPVSSERQDALCLAPRQSA